MNRRYSTCTAIAILLLAWNEMAALPADISFDFQAGLEEVAAASGERASRLLSLPGFSTGGDLLPGSPWSLPVRTETFLLPPGTIIESILVTDSVWVTLSGRYSFPLLPGLEPDQFPAGGVFPADPVGILRQGALLGFSAATLYGSPVRWSPATGETQILVSVSLSITTSPCDEPPLAPARESAWSRSVRLSAVESIVSNPGVIGSYQLPVLFTQEAWEPFVITQFPGPLGTAVDMVIVTTDEFAGLFQELADYRTRRGIVTTVRTVEWICEHYSGSDAPEKIRNFLASAHEEWGIQGVLIGGDAGVVPVREANGWSYLPMPFPNLQIPTDDYYGDIDGDWAQEGTKWRIPPQTGYLDLCVGRWPVNNPGDFHTMFTKLKLYESPEALPENFARRLLLMGSNNPAGTGAFDMMDLSGMLRASGSIPRYLDEPVELYFPHSLPHGNLHRNSALEQFDSGFNLILHADHAEIHKLGTAGSGTLGQYMWDSDWSTMQNSGRPSILWTLGCEVGHFDGAYCFSEAGLLTSNTTGLTAAISNSRGGVHGQILSAYYFADALFDTGYLASQHSTHPLHWPRSYLGEAFRISKNMAGMSYMYLNLLGSPFMSVWRGDPGQLSVAALPLLMTEGMPANITATVTDGAGPVENALVSLWKKDEVFALEYTDELGVATFENVAVPLGGTGQSIHVTAFKHREPLGPGSEPADYLPGTAFVEILHSPAPVVSLHQYQVDPSGDGAASPGETVDIHVSAVNTGGETAFDVSAGISVQQGHEHISAVPVPTASFPGIPPGQHRDSSDPFTVEISPDAPPGAQVLLAVTFTFTGSAGTVQWQSHMLLTVQAGIYSLTVLHPQADSSSGISAEVTVTGMVMANTGLGMDDWVELTAGNLHPQEPFSADLIPLPGIQPGSSAGVPGQLTLTVTPGDPGSEWLREGFPGCSFDLIATASTGEQVARTVDVELVAALEGQYIESPSNTAVYESGSNYLKLLWEHGGPLAAWGYFVYLVQGGTPVRVNHLPVPVQQMEVPDLEPGTGYEIHVTAVDQTGRESTPAVLAASTTCPMVPGWPILLYGSPGAGPLLTDADGDGNPEIVAISSFGALYIIKRNGSFNRLLPPAGYDYDRFLGVAAGDVYGDGRNEIVVTAQRGIHMEDHERVSVLLFRRTGMIWTPSEIAVTQVNTEVASTMTGGTPVLFQADDTPQLEIALRTRGRNGGAPGLYVWRHDPGTGEWVTFSEQFPVQLTGGFFDPPLALDYDGDGIEELIATTYTQGEPGTSLVLVNFQPEGPAVITTRDLYELNTGGYIPRAFGTMAAAQLNGVFHIAGVAKPESFCSDRKKVFVYTLEEGQFSHLWQTDWILGEDFFGNMPGPTISPFHGTEDLAVIYSLNGGVFNSEGVIHAWNLTDGAKLFQSEPMPFNPLVGHGGSSIRSQAVTGLTRTADPGATAVFSGFSTMLTAVDPLQPSVAGFPAFTSDAVWGAPLVADMNGDGTAEVLHIDASGHASLFDTGQYSHMATGWHMFQANPRRTGLHAPPAAVNASLDISLSSGAAAPVSGGASVSVQVTVEGAGPEAPKNFAPISGASLSAAGEEQVVVAVFDDFGVLGRTAIPLVNGTVQLAIPVARPSQGTVLGITADPDGIHRESNRTNNTLFVTVQAEPPTVSIPSPASALSVTISLSEHADYPLSINMYSLDGRVVYSREIQGLAPGLHTFGTPAAPGGRQLPAGLYAVTVCGLPQGEIVGKVMILP